MKMEKYEQHELSLDEMHEISGGNWWSDFKTGFTEGFVWATDVIWDILSFVGNLKTAAK